MIDAARHNDPETLRSIIALYEAEMKRLLARIEELTLALARLRGEDEKQALQLELLSVQSRLDKLSRRMFGPSSEKRPDPDRAKTQPTDVPKRERKGHGPRSQPQLPVEEVIHILDEADRVCPKCGGVLSEMHGHFEESSEITLIPPKLIRVIHKRQKYTCPNRDHIDTAIGPLKLMPGGRYSPEFALDIAISKYKEHTPLERLADRYGRQGLTVDVQTLFDQLYAAASALIPTWHALRGALLKEPRLFGDETGWTLMSIKSHGGAGREDWWMWSISAEKAAWYTFADSRSALVPAAFLNGYEGLFQCDGYSAYSSLESSSGQSSTVDRMRYLSLDGGLASARKAWLVPYAPKLNLGLCWAHVRRGFIDCERYFYKECKEFLGLVSALYRIENDMKALAASRASPVEAPDDYLRVLLELRRELRPEHSRKVVTELKTWLETPRILKQSALGKAISYPLKRWTALTRFLDEPLLELDNNAAERSLRGPVIGRKNHFGCVSERGLLCAAVFYSLFESAKLSRREPGEYVRQALRRSLEEPGSTLLPWERL